MTSLRGIGAVAILVLLSTSSTWAKELGEPLSPRALEEMLDNDDVKFLFDFRTNSSRDTDGYIETSILVPEELTLDKARSSPKSDVIPAGNAKGVVVYVADDSARAKEAEAILKHYGHANVLCYLAGMDEWEKVGGLIKYPKFVSFDGLNRLLDSNSILLIDVRNRTELNTVGQIPGSVCLPLHEVAAAMELSPEEFSGKYGFEKPDPDNRKIVLTCRSGRRVLVADDIMQSYGYDNLRIYSGSFNEWKAKGGKIISGQFSVDYE